METLECQTRTGSLGPPYNIQLKVQCSYQQSRKLYKCFEDIRVSIRQQHIYNLYTREEKLYKMIIQASVNRKERPTTQEKQTDGQVYRP